MKDVTTLEFYWECAIRMDLELDEMKMKPCACFVLQQTTAIAEASAC